MLNRARLLPAMVTCAVSLGPGNVAQALVPDSHCATKFNKRAIPKATKLAKAGKEAVLAARYDEALRLYSEAWCVLPEPTLKHGISVAAYNLGMCAQALDTAAFWRDRADPEDRQEAQDWYGTVRSQCVEVSIRSDPAGAAIRLDAATADLARAPWRGLLRAGPHRLVASKEGYRVTDEQITIPAGVRASPFGVTVTLVLPPPPSVEAPGVAPPPAQPPALAAPEVSTAQAAPQPAPQAAREAPQPAPPPSHAIPTWSPWIPTAVALASAGVAIGEGAETLKCSSSALPFGGSNSCVANDSLTSNIAWAVAGAGAVTAGAMWLFLALDKHHNPRPTTVQVSFTGNGAQVGGTF